MLRRLRSLSARSRNAQSDESGLSLIELVVAMSIFTVVLGIYFSALMSMSRTTVQAQDSVDASDALRATFNVLDHQVRYATSINMPGKGASGDSWYVELEATDLPDSQPSMCYQWQLDTTTQVLSYRTWVKDGSSLVTDWRGVSWGVESATAGSPFTFKAAGTTSSETRQALTVSLKVEGLTTDQMSEQQNTFIARNSSSQSPSNLDVNGDGVRDAVCMTGMNRP